MFETSKLTLYYNVGGSGRVANGANDDFDLKITRESNRLFVKICPKREMELVHAEIATDYSFQKETSVLANGYQSWSLTKEWKRDELQKGIRFPVNKIKFGREIAAINGDYNFKTYPKTAGFFHGYSFGYVRNGFTHEFIGSLNERSGWTILNFDFNKNLITLEKDVEGKTIKGDFTLFDVAFFNGSYDEVFDAYFKTLDVSKCRVNHTTGYTSWYNYFTKIDEKIILRDLEGLARSDKIDIFQIDDGHQTKVGDWLSTDKKKFPHGMKFIADEIHKSGYKAGLWLAPFYIEKDSVVAKTHPDWILKDANGKPTKGMLGTRPCFTLNFYIKECADYIRRFFDVILNEWGYDMVKLDFLYTACLVPFGNKTRGEIMDDACAFLRDCCGDKYILGCGVPLFPAFGRFDYCRIGSDVDIQFKPRFIFSLTNNEIVSTQTSIQNTIFRRGLDGRAFGNDPDVFFMREVNLKYTDSEKRLVAEVNKTFGRLLFISDNVGEFSQKQLDFLNEIYTKSEAVVTHVDYRGNNTAKVYFTENGKSGVWTINWLTGENTREFCN